MTIEASFVNNKKGIFYRGTEASKYNLFSVVNHHGSIDAGHYTSYIRLHEDTWYKCNDEIISKADLLDVLCSEG